MRGVGKQSLRDEQQAVKRAKDRKGAEDFCVFFFGCLSD